VSTVILRAATSDILGAIGNTALIELRNVVAPGAGRVLAKLESSNPTGSMKDRMALAGVEAAEADGRLTPGQPVVEYTGGSTGTSLALVCAAKGHPLWIVYSDAFSDDKLRHMAALGARVTMVNSRSLGITERLVKTLIETARGIGEREGAWWFDQLRNEACSRGFELMGDEIWEQTAGEIDAFVQSVGTAHSLMGTTRALRRHRPDMRSVAVEPAESPILSEGRTGAHHIEGIGIGFVPPLWDASLIDEMQAVTTQEAMAMARRLAVEEALFVGTSSGGNVIVANRLAQRLGPSSTVVTLLVDNGAKYLSTDLFGAPDERPIEAWVELAGG
jgi:cysteine synthase A